MDICLLASALVSPVFTPTTLYLGGLKRLMAYDMSDLSVRWTATIQGTGARSCAVERSIYLGADTHLLRGV